MEIKRKYPLQNVKVTAFTGKKQVWTKIIINDEIKTQMSHFNYLWNHIGYGKNYGTNR